MLLDLFIKNFVLIDKSYIEFNKGFSVVTGETGAGKSILLDALSLCCGEKGDVSFIKKSCDESCVSATFLIHKDDEIIPFLLENSLIDEETAFENNTCTIQLRRHLREKGSKFYVNDYPVKLQTLKTIGQQLFEINGQFDHLLNAKTHARFLDDYIQEDDFQECKKKLYSLYFKRKELIEALKALNEQEEKDLETRFYQEALLNDLENINIEENEEDQLLEERLKIENSGRYVSVLKDLYLKFTESSFIHDIQETLTKLERLSNTLSDSIMNPLQQIESYLLEVKEQIKDQLQDLSDAESRLNEIDERLYVLRKFAKKYHTDTKQLFFLLKNAKKTLSIDYTAQKEMLKNDLKKIDHDYEHYAKLLSEYREKYIPLLKADIESEFSFLKLSTAQFFVAHHKKTIQAASANGLDDIQFLIAVNKGQQPTPIEKSASGGELSRIMLALKSVLSLKNNVSTIIFDEIDTGVGGSVATAIGERMKKLSKKMQVLSITHSPQVACFADDHYFVEKKTNQEETITSILKLNEAEKRNEIARMLSGASITENSLSAAKDLQEFAQKAV